MKASSAQITSAVIAWLRFGKQMPYVIDELEVGMFRADVVGADEKQIVEVEVKVTMSDMERDFKSKGHKHQRYAEQYWINLGGVPNRLYFAVPLRLKDRALESLKKSNPAYGLVVMLENDTPYDYSLPAWKRLSVAKSAKPLHANKPTPRSLLNIVKRMGSDIAHWHLFQNEQQRMFDRVKNLSQAMHEGGPLASSDVEDILVKSEHV